jgi:hypothetical protein
MENPQEGPDPEVLYTWQSAPLISPKQKPPGTPLLPGTFTLGQEQEYIVPLPPLLDDLTAHKDLILCAEERDFDNQHALFIENTHKRPEESAVQNTHTTLLEPLTSTRIDIQHMPPTDLTDVYTTGTWVEPQRKATDRLLDLCLQPQRYYKPPTDN